jgi:arginyl-tRNA synthetase
MPNLKGQLKEIILNCLTKADLPADFLFVVEHPKVADFGDYSSNVAMTLARKLKKDPYQLAEDITGLLIKQKTVKELFSKVEAIKPGFINFYLSTTFLNKQVSSILALKGDYGQADLGQGKKVQLEFISANPTGPLTIGNGRGGFMGDVLANIMSKSGYEVEREFYINDTGRQVNILGASLIFALGLTEEIINKEMPEVLQYREDLYKGDYIKDLAEDYKKHFHDYQSEIEKSELTKIGQWAAKKLMEANIRTIKGKLKIKFDRYFSEAEDLKDESYNRLFNDLWKAGLVNGKEGAYWLKMEDQERVLIRSAGTENIRKIKIGSQEHKYSVTYLFSDLVYHYNKFIERKFDQVIDFWGADHHGYAIVLKEGVEKFLKKSQNLKIIIFQLVHLLEDGKEVKMSKRSGSFIELEELVDEVGLDVARFFFLMYSPDSHLNFDLKLAKEKSDKNPVYYVQYAYARICSILRQVDQEKLEVKKSALSYEMNEEKSLIKEIVKWPEVLEEIAITFQVQLLPAYAISLADKFHQFYNNCRVIDNQQVNYSRYELVCLLKKNLKEIFETLGVSAPEKM